MYTSAQPFDPSRTKAAKSQGEHRANRSVWKRDTSKAEKSSKPLSRLLLSLDLRSTAIDEHCKTKCEGVAFLDVTEAKADGLAVFKE
mmetsp:Transcript_79078/g.219730  ORF Transcript_79078/g.219730 Transcript_79078/m.219730 type:complete len:87 (-) Transcript_79078:798-1058(-)